MNCCTWLGTKRPPLPQVRHILRLKAIVFKRVQAGWQENSPFIIYFCFSPPSLHFKITHHPYIISVWTPLPPYLIFFCHSHQYPFEWNSPKARYIYMDVRPLSVYSMGEGFQQGFKNLKQNFRHQIFFSCRRHLKILVVFW